MKKITIGLVVFGVVLTLLIVRFGWQQRNKTGNWQRYTDEFLSFQIPKDWLVENYTSFYKINLKGMPVMDIYVQNNLGNKYSEKNIGADMRYVSNLREILVDKKKAVRYRFTPNPLNGQNQEDVEIFLPEKEKIIRIGFFGNSESLEVDIANYFEPFLASLSISNPSSQMVGNDKDEHGCIGSAGYSWCEEKVKCLRIWEEDCNSRSKIAQALSLKEKRQVLPEDITLTQETAEYARGKLVGGMLLAVKVNGAWQIVYAGNGGVDCVSLKNNYQFPVEMLVGFCD